MASVKTTLYGKQGESKFALEPATSAIQVSVADELGGVSNVEAELIKLRQQIAAAVDAGVHFQGVVTQSEPLPTVAYRAGWQYYVKEKGTYAGQTCEVGDFIICIRAYASGSASNADWAVLQANLTGVVTGPSSSVAAHVVVFEGTSGDRLADSGFTIGASVPAGAKFTDTTYAPATDQADGLMTAAEHIKLSGIETGADQTNATNVAAAGAFMKLTDNADSIADGAQKVLMTAEERLKLSGIAAGAEVNQNAIASAKVGETVITATGKTDQLEFAAGSGVTITADVATKKITVAETYVDSCVVEDLESVPGNLRDGGLIILKA